jgi:hypothetical protein
MEFRFEAPGKRFRCALRCVQCEGRVANGRCEREVCVGTPLCWQHLRRVGLEIKESAQPDAGKGLFAYQFRQGRYVFSRGSPIVKMHSEKTTRRELRRRYGDWTAPYGIEEGEYAEDGACLRGIGMLANHSSRRANAEYRLHEGDFWIFAKENIAHGEEILVNYGDQYELDEPGVSHETRAVGSAARGARSGRSGRSERPERSERSERPKPPELVPRSKRKPAVRPARVGESVRVFWPKHDAEFKGTVERVSGKYTLVKYKDGSAWHKNLSVH